MGILNSGILGGFRNKTGTVIGRRYRGQDIMTGLYKISEKPEQDGEVIQQHRFSILNSFLSRISALVDIGFKQHAKKKSAVNAAYSFNAPHAYINDGEETVLNYPKLVYSRGQVDTPDYPQVSFSGEDTIVFSWLPQEQSMYSRANDKASFLIYIPENSQAIIVKNGALRADLSFGVELPPKATTGTFHCYMNFNNDSGKLVGDSVYVGMLT
jgi:hypothetical protein